MKIIKLINNNYIKFYIIKFYIIDFRESFVSSY
jgi:hypothetical protein